VDKTVLGPWSLRPEMALLDNSQQSSNVYRRQRGLQQRPVTVVKTATQLVEHNITKEDGVRETMFNTGRLIICRVI